MSSDHRVVIEFDGGGTSARLVCPEGGCTPAGQCGYCGRDLHDPDGVPCYDCRDAEKWRDECWIKTWFDNLTAEELLHGRVEVLVSAEWEFDHPVVRIESAAEAAQ